VRAVGRRQASQHTGSRSGAAVQVPDLGILD
jgi:hypothetical protein